MQFKVLTASLLASAGISMAAPLEARQETCPIAKSGSYVWEISNFSAHKPSGEAISTLTFDVRTTAGNLADFKCTGSDVADAQWYGCENAAVSFAFQNDRSGLIVKHNTVDGVKNVATTTVLNTCRHGPDGGADFICESSAPTYVTFVQYPNTE
ncbi:hypothetical protein E8E12_010065 [Didymella heteroderae]|uniref:AA1-like domain-containing protein n=1 Tax=Didymella heteroderae TaxID=1769908 RepID=A0A9P4WXQ9_9PLEO|nr:hypothetical protein E8E12_010065 [Didymella heteroderae]